MTPSGDCVNLVKQFEGCRLVGYADITGVPTIGYGHTGPEVRVGDTIDQRKADAYLLKDLTRASEGVNQALGGYMATQNEFDALVSFAYNLGINALRNSTLLRKFVAGDTQGAADEFLKWDHAGGKVVAGLTRRRAAERDLFLSTKDRTPGTT